MTELNQRPIWLNNFISNYQQLSTDNLYLLDKIYDSNIEFHDATSSINGLADLQDYFNDLYTNISSCQFDITGAIFQENQAAIYWNMTFVHKSLNSGKPISIEGNSLIKGSSNKVYYHKDYLDMGAMVYEHIPLIGRLIRTIKSRMGH